MAANVRFPRIGDTKQPIRGAITKLVALIVGIAAVLMGVLWIGQGTGFVHWPESSFMIDRRPWAVRGVILAAVGLILIVASRRR